MKKIVIFALGAHGEGISGGDRIFIEFARRWQKHVPVEIVLWGEGQRMCERHNLQGKNITYRVISMEPWSNIGLIVNYMARIVKGIWYALTVKLSTNEKVVVYSASEFWMDALPAWMLKLRHKNVHWVASWYQTAPNPIAGFSEKKRDNVYRKSALFYWLAQLPIKPLVIAYADVMFVNNLDEKKRYNKVKKNGKVEVVIGAVDTIKINKWIKENGDQQKKYDAVFQCRFHPQKGVVELVEIWKKVVEQIPSAKLVMIGDGPLMLQVKEKIQQLNLNKNIELLGYVFDGDKKYATFAQSKLVVHPAMYDSGGMAAAEAMSFGIPCIGFDLKAYESYYPKGMVVSENSQKFAQNTIRLLRDEKKRKNIGAEARELILNKYSWDARAEENYLTLQSL